MLNRSQNKQISHLNLRFIVDVLRQKNTLYIRLSLFIYLFQLYINLDKPDWMKYKFSLYVCKY